MRIGTALFALALMWASATVARADTTIVVGFAAGGASTIAARHVAKSLQEIMGATVLVESVDGASGLLAAKHVMQQKPDGKTFMLLSSTSLLSVPPSLGFSYVALVATYDYVFVTGRRDFGTLGDYVHAVRGGNDALRNVATAGPVPHLIADRMLRKRGVEMVHVGYKGSKPAAVDAAGGHIATALVPYSDAQALEERGSLRVLARSGSGIKQFGWVGIVAPPGMAEQEIDRWGRLFRKAVELSAERLEKSGFKKRWRDGASFRELHETEYGLLKPEADRLKIDYPKP